jgi:hypothetical protein
MPTQYDEKGKFFTDVITKLPQTVTIQTTAQIIHGEIHVRPDDRLLDELNHTEKFIAVTNAVVSDLNGVTLFRCKFLTLNSDQIIWLIPDKELVQE